LKKKRQELQELQELASRPFVPAMTDPQERRRANADDYEDWELFGPDHEFLANKSSSVLGVNFDKDVAALAKMQLSQ
jgi:hypothetical protein